MKAGYFTFAAVAACSAALLSVSGAHAASGSVGYDSIPSPLPPNVVSLGYEATSTTEFGDDITLSGTNRRVETVTVTMSAWALHSSFPLMSPAGWSHPIRLSFYSVNTSGPTHAKGALIGSATQSFLIPWRPEADLTCPNPSAWRAGDGSCYNGYAFNITFNLLSQNINLPDEVIFGIAYNTADYGTPPIGAPGPYNSLNVGLRDATVFGSPTAGTDVEPDALFWNTSFAGFYTDGGAGGVGIFRRDTNWTPYTPAVQITLLPCGSNADCDDADVCNGSETCDVASGTCQAGTPLVDTDGDGTCDARDNCPSVFNYGQSDGNDDGVGDLCDAPLTLPTPWKLSRVRLKSSSSANKATIRATGVFSPSEIGDDIAEALTFGAGVAVSGAGLSAEEGMIFPYPRCVQLAPTRFTCVGTKAEELKLKRKRNGDYAVTITASHRSFAPPLSTAGVEVSLSLGRLDRRDGTGSCSSPGQHGSATCKK